MKANFQFSNVCGTVYRQGNVLFTSDGNSLLSPVGNRVTVFDLVNNRSRTLPFENRKNISAIALSPDGHVLISVDEDGRALLVNFRKATVLHHFNFKRPVRAIVFSPNSKYIAVTHDSHIQVWQTPNPLMREFAPFVLHRTYTGHHDEVLSLTWSNDSRFFLSTSRDMTAKLFTLDPLKDYKPLTFAGHRDAIVGAYFSSNSKTIYTISKDGALFVWRAKPKESGESESEPELASDEERINVIARTRWGIHSRHYFNQPGGSKVTSCAFHKKTSLLIVGFSTGIFGLYELPAFTKIHTLSISQEKITSVAISPSGEWLAFGASKQGQLLVWEWQSESYILKQQGHYFDMNTLSYSTDGQTIATGGDDGKIKLWNTTSGFCFVTFSEHTASVSTVEFAKQGQVLFSASLDGTVRAYDLLRYRNFRTFTSPNPVQFSSLTVDPSGEVVSAGSNDSFEVFMWSVQTGKLLDILSGHEGPISCLSFSPSGNQMASGSWDKTVRLWSVFGRSRSVDPIQLSTEVLALAYRPDGKELASSTLDGQIVFWDVSNGKQTGLIEGRKDASGGRRIDDRVSAANNSSGKSFNSLAYTADGTCIIAGGNTKYVLIYDVKDGVMLKKFQISENISLDGTQEFLDSRRLNEAGVSLDLIDDRGDDSDLEERLDNTLPGTVGGDLSKRRYKRTARTKCVRFSPTGLAWAAASTDGLLIYSISNSLTFDPFELTIDLTPQSILATLSQKEYLKALIMALKLNEQPLVQKVYESIPSGDIKLIIRQLPVQYLSKILQYISKRLEKSPHLEYDLLWINGLVTIHGRWLREHSIELASVFRGLNKGLVDWQEGISTVCESNAATLSYLVDQMKRQDVAA